MAGSSSIQGDQTVTFTDNMSFDGTDRGGAMSADGQLWIGATASNRSDNGGHVRLGSISAGTGITVTNGPGTITIASSAAATDLHVARFIVASSTGGTGANFTSIAAAIASAQGTGINSTIFIQPGTYTENITLVPGINICAFDCDATTPNVTIVGTLTLTAAGTVSLSGLRLQTNSAAAIAVTGNSASILHLKNCYLNFTNNTGITYSSSSGSSGIFITDCKGNLGTTGIGLFTHTASGSMQIFNSMFSNTGGSSTASTCSAGGIDISNCQFTNPLTMTATSAGTWEWVVISTVSQNVTSANLNGGSISCKWCRFQSGSAVAISIASSAASVEFCNVASSNVATISGAGTLNFGPIDFSGTTSAITVTTQVPLVATNDAIKVVTPGAYPYTTVSQDGIILVDTSAARSIVPLASPTTGQRHIIKDSVGTAAAFNITVTPSGKNIDGAASYVINSNYGSITIVYNGTEWSIV